MQGTPATPATSGDGGGTAFGNYLNSTGYKFQLGQGTRAITGSAAARGVLNSGGTAKALTQYGQGLGGQYFNNYLTQLGSLNTQQGNTAITGVNAAKAVGDAGTAGGTVAGGQKQSGITSAAGQFGGQIGNFLSLF